MKSFTLFAGQLSFATAWFLLDSPLTWVFILGGFGCLFTVAVIGTVEMCEYIADSRKAAEIDVDD